MDRRYVHDRPDWPEFRWRAETLRDSLTGTRHRLERLAGRVEAMGLEARLEAEVNATTREVLGTSRIEGEFPDPDLVRSSVARRLGMDAGERAGTDREVEGIVEIVVSATRDCGDPLTVEQLFSWHAGLFPDGRSGLHRIQAGAWRTGPVQVVSGPAGKERVHFEGPAAERVPEEMERFLDWFNTPSDTDGVIRAGIAHLWFVTIHPFQDGNGRIGRAVADMGLANSQDSPRRFYSMSHRILRERAEYYRALERATRGECDITGWLTWFTGCLGRVMDDALAGLSVAGRNAALRERAGGLELNPRQLRVLELLMREPEESLTAARWARITRSTLEEAEADIRAMLDAELLEEAPDTGVNPRYRLALAG